MQTHIHQPPLIQNANTRHCNTACKRNTEPKHHQLLGHSDSILEVLAALRKVPPLAGVTVIKGTTRKTDARHQLIRKARHSEQLHAPRLMSACAPGCQVQHHGETPAVRACNVAGDSVIPRFLQQGDCPPANTVLTYCTKHLKSLTVKTKPKIHRPPPVFLVKARVDAKLGLSC